MQPSACKQYWYVPVCMYVPEGGEVSHAEGCLRERHVGLLAHQSQHEEDYRYEDHSAVHPRQHQLQQAHGEATHRVPVQICKSTVRCREWRVSAQQCSLIAEVRGASKVRPPPGHHKHDVELLKRRLPHLVLFLAAGATSNRPLCRSLCLHAEPCPTQEAVEMVAPSARKAVLLSIASR